jgi:hypothetical protein
LPRIIVLSNSKVKDRRIKVIPLKPLILEIKKFTLENKQTGINTVAKNDQFDFERQLSMQV